MLDLVFLRYKRMEGEDHLVSNIYDYNHLPHTNMILSTCTPAINGSPYIQWIYALSGDCIYGWQECISLLLGYLSIFCWLNAQMPQVIKNYRLGDAESLSISFLTVWLIGDVANFIGCIATHQLPFQLYLSVYFIIIDTILCLQYLYYVRYSDNPLRRWLRRSKEQNELKVPTERSHLLANQKKNDNKSPSSYKSTTTTLMMLGLCSFYYTSTIINKESQLTTMASTTTTNDNVFMVANDSRLDDDFIWVGRFFAWLCTFLYLSSRLPQIIKNFQRRSVDGLSMALFFFAACGNMTYVLSIFVNPHTTRKVMLEAVPYLLGSAGTLCFDGAIFCQYLVYRPYSNKLAQQYYPGTMDEERMEQQ